MDRSASRSKSKKSGPKEDVLIVVAWTVLQAGTTIAAAAFTFYVYKPGWMLGGVAVAYSEVAANSNI